MFNNVKMKSKEESFQSKLLNTDPNNKNNNTHKPHIIQVLKKREINLSNFDPIKYRRALLNAQIPKKVIKNKEQKKQPYIKKNNYRYFGPYNKLINGGGGFCKRLYNKNYNLNLIYELFPQNVPKYKQNTDQMNLSSYRNNNEKKTRKINQKENMLIQENIYEDDNINSININKIYNDRYKLKNNKKSSLDKKYCKINIEEVNNSIKYLKLNNNLTYRTQLSKREKSRKNKNDKKISNKLIDISYKKTKTEKKNKKIIFDGIDIKKLELNQSSIQTTPNKEIPKTERILIKDNIEQFSMENKQIKKFSNLTEADSVLLKFSPIKKDKSFELQNRIDNYTISSDRIEYSFIKKIPKKEPEKKKKLVINTNELVILSKKPKPKINNIINNNNNNNSIILNPNKKNEEILNKEKEEEIIKVEPKKEEIVKPEPKNEEIIKVESKIEEIQKEDKKEEEKEKDKEDKKEEEKVKEKKDKEDKKEEKQKKVKEEKENNIILNSIVEIKDYQSVKENNNTHENINTEKSEKDEKEDIENRKASKTVVDKFARFKERLKRKNEANKKKEENKPNRIKNLAFELESKMYKKEVDKEEENKNQNDNKKNNNPIKNEINYNIPVVNKRKMKKKIFTDD